MSLPPLEAPLLPRADWLQVVRHAPLVSIDLILRDAQGRVLLGHARTSRRAGCGSCRVA